MKKLGNNKGAAAVEFALVIIPLLIIVFGIIEFGLLMYNQQVLTNAAREGVRRGIVQATPRIPISNGTDGIVDVVHNYADAHLITFSATPTTLNVDVKVNGSTGICIAFADNLSVRVTYPYTFLVVQNFMPGLGSSLTLSSEAVMKCE